VAQILDKALKARITAGIGRKARLAKEFTRSRLSRG
jgi:hypothetical protein